MFRYSPFPSVSLGSLSPSLCVAPQTAAGKFILRAVAGPAVLLTLMRVTAAPLVLLLCVSEMLLLLLWMPTTAENPSECRSRQVVVC